jgi:hypothetical protein
MTTRRPEPPWPSARRACAPQMWRFRNEKNFARAAGMSADIARRPPSGRHRVLACQGRWASGPRFGHVLGSDIKSQSVAVPPTKFGPASLQAQRILASTPPLTTNRVVHIPKEVPATSSYDLSCFRPRLPDLVTRPNRSWSSSRMRPTIPDSRPSIATPAAGHTDRSVHRIFTGCGGTDILASDRAEPPNRRLTAKMTHRTRMAVAGRGLVTFP